MIPLKAPNQFDLANPAYVPDVFVTPGGTCYLKEAGVSLVASTECVLDSVSRFLEGFDPDLGFHEYLDDGYPEDESAALPKLAGQLCYLSFGPNRTKQADAGKYLDHIKASGHGSVLEHVAYTFLLWGIDRATTHELVRHRVGMSYSQVSQRYVDGKTLRFVQRPEIQPERLPIDASPDLYYHVKEVSENWQMMIDADRDTYDQDAAVFGSLADMGHPAFQGMTKTDSRKRLNQVARECLPNCTEAPILVTGNGRSWRNFLDQRATPSADVPIRELAVKVLRCLKTVSPGIFGDYVVATLPDGTEAAETPYRKV